MDGLWFPSDTRRGLVVARSLPRGSRISPLLHIFCVGKGKFSVVGEVVVSSNGDEEANSTPT